MHCCTVHDTMHLPHLQCMQSGSYKCITALFGLHLVLTCVHTHLCPAIASFVLLLVLLPCSLASAHAVTSAKWRTQCLVSGAQLLDLSNSGVPCWLLLLLLLLPGCPASLHCACAVAS
jgi:hypothetical protein